MISLSSNLWRLTITWTHASCATSANCVIWSTSSALSCINSFTTPSSICTSHTLLPEFPHPGTSGTTCFSWTPAGPALGPEPFLSFSSLGASTSATSQVNQQRLASSARQPQLPSYGHHCQGPAVWPPQLPHAPRIKDCISNVNGESVIQFGVKVYPPQVSTRVTAEYGFINIFYFSALPTRISTTLNFFLNPSLLG